MMPLRFGLYGLLVLMSACSKASSTSSDDLPASSSSSDTNATFTFQYGADSSQTIDLYLPFEFNDSTPLLVLVHGGGWVAGSHEELATMALYFQLQGLAVANLEYRLANGEYTIKNQLEDIDSSMNFLLYKSGLFSVRHFAPYLAGFSAGAHLVLLDACLSQESFSLGGVYAWAPPVMLYDSLLQAWLPNMVEIATANDTDLEQVYSPNLRIGASMPPVWLFHGEVDALVPVAHSKAMSDSLHAKKFKVSLSLYPDAGHALTEEALGDFVDSVLQNMK